MHQLIHDIALCIIAAWALGVVAQFFGQPAILAYLIGGFSIGPAGLGFVHGQESIATISELGLIFLLFMIGLEIDLNFDPRNRGVANPGRRRRGGRVFLRPGFSADRGEMGCALFRDSCRAQQHRDHCQGAL